MLARSGLPPPEQTKTSAMPINDCLGPYDRQGLIDPRCNLIKPGERQAVEGAKRRSLRRLPAQDV